MTALYLSASPAPFNLIVTGIVITLIGVVLLRCLLAIKRQWKCQEALDAMRQCEVREMHCRLHLEELIRRGTLVNIPGAAAAAEYMYRYFTGSDRRGPATEQEWERVVAEFAAGLHPSNRYGRKATHKCKRCGSTFHLRNGDALTCYTVEDGGEPCPGVLVAIDYGLSDLLSASPDQASAPSAFNAAVAAIDHWAADMTGRADTLAAWVAADGLALRASNAVLKLLTAGQLRVKYHSMQDIIELLQPSAKVMQRWLRLRGGFVPREAALTEAAIHLPNFGDEERIVQLARIEVAEARLGINLDEEPEEVQGMTPSSN